MKCDVSADGTRPVYCYRNNEKIKELEEAVKELKDSMKVFREKSDRRDDSLMEHILHIEQRVSETEKNHEVALKANTDALTHLEKTLTQLSEVNSKTIETLNKMDRQLITTTDRVNYTDKRISAIEEDIKDVKSTVTAVRGEIRTVDDKTKVDVAKSWTEQVKQDLPKILAGGGIVGIAIALLKQFLIG